MDDIEINNLITDEVYDSATTKYNEVQWEYITDSNGLGYQDGLIKFQTSSLRSKYVCMRDCVLQVPLNIVASGSNYTQASLVVFKQSILDMFFSVLLKSSSGQVVVNDQNVSIYNKLRLLLEHDTDWETTEGPSLCFSKDKAVLPTATVGIVNPTNATTNTGFASKIQFFKQQATFATGGAPANNFGFVVSIPLRYLHDIFESGLNFPMLNSVWELNIGLQAYNNTTLSPMVTDSSLLNPPVITVGSATVPGSGLVLNQCRLYYKSIKFSPEINKQIYEKLARGWQKKINFRVCDTYVPTLGTDINQTSGTINRQLNPACVNPTRVFLLAPATNTLTTAGGSSNSGLANYLGSFGSASILVDNQSYYNNQLNTSEDWYNILKEQMPSSGGLISFADFNAAYHIMCYDISRLKGRSVNPQAAVSIQVNATRTDSTACDYYYLIERADSCVLNMSTGDVQVVSVH